GDREAVYNVRLLMDDVPDGVDVLRIRAELQIPELLEVTRVVPNRRNLPAGNLAWHATDDGIRVRIDNPDGSAVSFANRDGGKTVFTVHFKLKKELTVRVNEEIKARSLEID